MPASLFSFIPEERMLDILECLHQLTRLSILLMDADGGVLHRFGETNGCCTLLRSRVFTGDECPSLYRQAGARARELGEAYIFTCHANFNHIAFPMLHEGALLAIILIGPFLMDRPDSTLVSGLAESRGLSATLSLEIYDELTSLPVLETARVNHLSKLVGHLLSPLLPAERVVLLANQEKLYQQSRINETIQMYKGLETLPAQDFLFEKENALLQKVRTGNVPEAKAVLNDLLGYVFFSEGGRLDTIRARAIGLTALLTRVAMEGGAKRDSVYSLNRDFLPRLNDTDNMEGLCYLMQHVVESFMEAMFDPLDKGNPYVRKALSLISERYGQPLTLETVARETGLSPNYFSALFHQTTGASFREHLNRVRIEESRRLLLNTDYSLADIAVAVGFTDQSYFCKVFRSLVGLSPGRFRSGSPRKP
ncbi:MAG: helix-turn-helix domain-containing protein [Clostridia bacterium]|nr:helix-turn-helix domain-containing protein [Clostridia bacterium]